MKFLTLALFLGVATAEDIDDDVAHMLKISISKHGQHVIEREADDVEHTWKQIEHSQPVRNLEASLKRWGESREVYRLKQLDKKFLASPEGKRLIAEWKDVGKILKQNLRKTKNGITFPNSKMDALSDELDDVADQYEGLEKSKWSKAYDAAFKKAFSNKQAASVGRRAKAFKHSREGKALRKELKDLKMAIKKHLKVTDLPKKLEQEEDDRRLEQGEDDRRLEQGEDDRRDEEDADVTSMLKISVSPKGQKIIEKEAEDVKETWMKIKDSQSVRNVGNSLKRWGESDEVDALKELDKKFLASKEGKRLVKEWKDFGEALKKAIHETKDGIRIDNDKIDDISDEADDVADQYEQLKKTHWQKEYEQAWNAALSNKQAESLGRRLKAFDKSKEGHALDKELRDLDMALKKNIKVTDLPKKLEEEEEEDVSLVSFEQGEDDRRDDDEDEVEDDVVANMLKITISKEGQEEIEEQWEDVEETWKRIEHTSSVRNVENSAKRWAKSKEVKDYQALEKKFLKTPRGKRMVREWQDVFRALDKAIKKTKNGIKIDNDKLDDLGDEADDVAQQYKELEKTHWQKDFEAQSRKAFSNKQAESLGRRLKTFKHSKEGRALKKEVHDFKHALKKNVKVTDLPKKLEEEENPMTFFI